MGLMGRNKVLSITNSDYPKGYTFFIFNLTPDMSRTNAQPERAALSLNLKFAKPVPEPVTVLIYSLFDGVFEVTENRQVFVTKIF